jgi:hypothetical protein
MPEHEHRLNDDVQFPPTPEGRRAKRELAAWSAQYRKQLALERERDELREKIRLLQAERLAVLAEHSTANLTLVVSELMVEVRSLKRQLDQVQRSPHNRQPGPVATPAPNGSKPHTPQNTRWRTYDGFRLDMQHREQVALEAQRKLEYQKDLDIDALSAQSGADSAKTVRRTMVHYHLEPERDWPPSTWPDEEPVQQLGFGGHGMAAVLAATFVFGMADAVADNKLDGVMHLCKLLGHWLGVPA